MFNFPNFFHYFSNTDAIEIVHQNQIIGYGEVRKGKSLVKAGEKVIKGQEIGYVGSLSIKGVPSMMLHLEMYSNPSNTGTLTGTNIYKRRSYLVDSTPF